MVESLTGYVVRLAEAHCVSAGLLYWKEIRSLAGKGNIFTFRVTNGNGYSTHTINSLGAPAADFVRVLEMLTGRHDLRALTLLTWAQVLPRAALLRRARAWCESCVQAWHQAHRPLYEPLLWTLQAVTVCPYHQRPLRHVCPHCERPLGPLDWRSRSAYCSRCAHPLVPHAVGPVQTLPRPELLWATWAPARVGNCSPLPRSSAARLRETASRIRSGGASSTPVPGTPPPSRVSCRWGAAMSAGGNEAKRCHGSRSCCAWPMVWGPPCWTSSWAPQRRRRLGAWCEPHQWRCPRLRPDGQRRTDAGTMVPKCLAYSTPRSPRAPHPR